MGGIYGADVSTAVNASQWKALMSEHDVSFGIVRCYESSGRVDPNAATTVNEAWAAGLSSVAVYHFPALGVTAAAQVQAVAEALAAASAKVDMYWIDVEKGGGWSPTDFAGNAALLTQLIQAAEAAGFRVGIYTSIGEWPETVNDAAFSSYPLWYADYDDQPSFAAFVPFGGWKAPLIKQFVGNQVRSGVEIDGNWAAGPLPGAGAGPGVTLTETSAPTSAEPSAIRANVTAYATSIAGTDATSSYAKYVAIIAPGETTETQASMATMNSCGLTVAGIWRACGYYGAALNAPYKIGAALSRLAAIGEAASGYTKYEVGMLPSPGDMILLGGEEHVYTVISVDDQGGGNAVIHSVDGGQPSPTRSGAQGSGADAILSCQHTWSGGQDKDPYFTRPILAIIDVTKVVPTAQMPLAGLVESAPPGSLGVLCEAVIGSEVASAIAASAYKFCIRYASLNTSDPASLTTAEAQAILGAGLGLMLAQRVDASSLTLSASLGTEHGGAMAKSASSVGLPMCVNLWLLLRGVPAGASAASVISYYNAWYAAVYDAGFLPGLCVVATEVLSASQLGDLAFSHYFELSGASVTPQPRGFQLVEGGAAVVGGTSMTSVTAKNDAGSGSAAGPGQAAWLVARL